MCHGLLQPYGAPLAELVTCECMDQRGIEERGRGEIGAINEVLMPEGGWKKKVDFWAVHLGVGGVRMLVIVRARLCKN